MMVSLVVSGTDYTHLRNLLGEGVAFGVELAPYTAARIGGPADAFFEVNSAHELGHVVRLCWQHGISFVVIGGGANILVSDAGVRGLVILNRARKVDFGDDLSRPKVWAESGANLGVIARQAARRGLAGLEWAVGIPGTLGGAVVGNAGAHGQDIAGCLILAEILHRIGKKNDIEPTQERWSSQQLGFEYRSSTIKRQPGDAIVLAVELGLQYSAPEVVQARVDELSAYRRLTQPPGASIGSMFKNPPGDAAGRLIEQIGLKGTRVGDAQISVQHANFFINLGHATARDVAALIQLAQEKVAQQTGVNLELEIELIGEW